MAKHIKRCSTSLISRKMQIKTIVRDHLTLVIIAIIKKATNWGLVVTILGFLFFFLDSGLSTAWPGFNP